MYLGALFISSLLDEMLLKVGLCRSVNMAPCSNRFQCTGAQSSPQWDTSCVSVEKKVANLGGIHIAKH